MTLWTPDYLARLGLQAGASARDVKRAYARALKALDQDTQAEAFAQLRQDYENSLQFVSMEIQIVLGEPEQGEPAPVPPEPVLLPEPAGSPAEAESPAAPIEEQEVALAFAAFESAAQQLSSVIFSDWVALLTQHLQSPALVALSARDAFEAHLVHALHQRSFGERNGPVLLCSAEVFGWNSDGRNRLDQWGWEGAQLSTLLDEASLLTSQERADWLHLTAAPDPTTLKRLLYKRAKKVLENLVLCRQKCPQLCAFFYSDNHIARWQSYESTQPPQSPDSGIPPPVGTNPGKPLSHSQRLLQWLSDHFVDSPKKLANYCIALLVLVVVIPSISVVIKISNDHQNSTACDTLYATAMENNWHDFLGGDIPQLKQCAKEAPPMMCSDRADMLKVIGIAERLGGSSYSLRGLRLRTSSGQSYAIAAGKDKADVTANLAMECMVARSLVFNSSPNSNWLELGDEPAARNVVEALAQCDSTPLVFATDASERTLLKFLQHVDAWPIERGASPGPRIPLMTLISPPKPIAEAELVHPYNPWPACVTNPPDILNAPEKSISAGPGERREIANRASRASEP